MHILPRPRISRIALLVAVGIFAVSCGSYQQASYYDNDGIYAQNPDRVTVERPVQQRTQPQPAQEKDGIYEDYFGQKADQIDDIMENEVFLTFGAPNIGNSTF